MKKRTKPTLPEIIDRAYNVSWWLLWIGLICFACGWWFGIFFWIVSFLYSRLAIWLENNWKKRNG